MRKQNGVWIWRLIEKEHGLAWWKLCRFWKERITFWRAGESYFVPHQFWTTTHLIPLKSLSTHSLLGIQIPSPISLDVINYFLISLLKALTLIKKIYLLEGMHWKDQIRFLNLLLAEKSLGRYQEPLLICLPSPPTHPNPLKLTMALLVQLQPHNFSNACSFLTSSGVSMFPMSFLSVFWFLLTSQKYAVG